MPPPRQMVVLREPFMSLDPSHLLLNVAEDVLHRAIKNGICATITTDGRREFSSLPVAVFPTKCDAVCFASAQRLQVLNNNIIHNIANNHELLEKHLKNCPDDFVKKLFAIYDICRKEGFKAPYQMGIFRTDYRIDSKKCLKQVQTKTIAVNYGGISSGLNDLHRYTVKSYQKPPYSEMELERYMPQNESSVHIAQTLLEALKHFGPKHCPSMLVVVPKNDTMKMDQKWIETEINRNAINVSIYSRTFEELFEDLTIDEPDKILTLTIYNPGKLGIKFGIDVVWYRTGSRAQDYSNERCFQVRQIIEQSAAIKCPSIQYQLASLPIFRLLLSDRRSLKKLIDLPYSANAELFGTFNKYCEINEQTVKIAMEDPERWYLMSKFQPEECPEIENFCSSHSANLMLTEFTEQKPYAGKFIVKSDINWDHTRIEKLDLVDELGIYGVIIGKYGVDEIHQNRLAGFLMRSKPNDSFHGSKIMTTPYLDYRLPLNRSRAPNSLLAPHINQNRLLLSQRGEDYIRMMNEYNYDFQDF